jgi:membrane protein implicated in regulation of membrane protease activity
VALLRRDAKSLSGDNRRMLLIGAILLALFVLPDAWGPPVVLAALLIEVAELFFWIRFSRKGNPRAGAQTLVGAVAKVIEPCRPIGRVWLDGEAWQARCDEGADVGEPVRVRSIDGIRLVVERMSENAEPQAPMN